ncbi:UNVERIFIED_CONTAM: Alpha-glucan water dikinase, chloroplastic [Sesamum latifolium]|uniref:Alpha-glucan water dikinase, chloroplastic n=1 Tax=Sesamum latifolium TaxID=2727402 RepID=A0AAW2X4D3_9LAMI
MSNSIGNNFLHQSLLSPTVLEHQSRINSSSCAGGNTLFQLQANSLTNKSCISTAFRGNRLRIQKNKLLMGKERAVLRWPQAVLAADASAEVHAEKFHLDGNTELQAVHSGADLESAVAHCMGYKDEGEGFMVGVHINPISGLPSGFQELIRYVLLHIEDKNVEALLEGLLEAREELRPSISQPKDRLKDLIFLDIALDSTVRTTVERGYEELSNASPEVLGYPSKPVGLFIRPSIIFRSDSNGEDLEGYAGAGLYDSIPMDEEEKVIVDYSSDPLIVDGEFRRSILSSIAQAGSAIEDLYGSAQDIEGVVKDGKIYVVQTRPQM